jgi:hypothetical protein
MNPENFNDLPEPTKKFLTSLSEKDVTDFWQAIELYREIKTVSGFVKWLIITSLASFLTMVSLGDAFGKVLSWLKGSPR